MAVKLKQDPGSRSAGFSCYLGPTLVGLIQTMTIYPVGPGEALKLPEVELALKREPRIAALIVDGASLSAARIKVKTPGEELYRQAQALRRRERR